MRRTPLKRRQPLKATGTPMKRGKPLQRASRLRQRNQKRTARLFVKQFESEERRRWMRNGECDVPSCRTWGCDPHHEPPRSVGGLAGDMTRLCRPHHIERHSGIGLDAFELKHGVNLELQASRHDRAWRARDQATD